MKIRYWEGTDSGCRTDGDATWVFGNEFGSCFIAHNCGLDEAIDQWDEEFGERIDHDDQALSDYGTREFMSGFDWRCLRNSFGADEWDEMSDSERGYHWCIQHGVIRVNDGGTDVWVSDYETMTGYPSLRAAVAELRAANGGEMPEFEQSTYNGAHGARPRAAERAVR